MVFCFKNLVFMDITNGGKSSTNFENPIVARFRVFNRHSDAAIALMICISDMIYLQSLLGYNSLILHP